MDNFCEGIESSETLWMLPQSTSFLNRRVQAAKQDCGAWKYIGKDKHENISARDATVAVFKEDEHVTTVDGLSLTRAGNNSTQGQNSNSTAITAGPRTVSNTIGDRNGEKLQPYVEPCTWSMMSTRGSRSLSSASSSDSLYSSEPSDEHAKLTCKVSQNAKTVPSTCIALETLPTEKDNLAQPILSQNMTIEELCLFRTRICPRKVEDDSCTLEECCPFSHCLSWHRRNPKITGYRPTLCPNVIFSIGPNKKMRVRNHCRRGRLCLHSHTKEEQMYHPLVYKTQLCRDWPQCSKHFCPFAHGSLELRSPQDVDFPLAQGPEKLETPMEVHRATLASQDRRSTTSSSIRGLKCHNTRKLSDTNNSKKADTCSPKTATPIERKQDQRKLYQNKFITPTSPKPISFSGVDPHSLFMQQEKPVVSNEDGVSNNRAFISNLPATEIAYEQEPSTWTFNTDNVTGAIGNDDCKENSCDLILSDVDGRLNDTSDKLNSDDILNLFTAGMMLVLQTTLSTSEEDRCPDKKNTHSINVGSLQQETSSTPVFSSSSSSYSEEPTPSFWSKPCSFPNIRSISSMQGGKLAPQNNSLEDIDAYTMIQQPHFEALKSPDEPPLQRCLSQANAGAVKDKTSSTITMPDIDYWTTESLVSFLLNSNSITDTREAEFNTERPQWVTVPPLTTDDNCEARHLADERNRLEVATNISQSSCRNSRPSMLLNKFENIMRTENNAADVYTDNSFDTTPRTSVADTINSLHQTKLLFSPGVDKNSGPWSSCATATSRSYNTEKNSGTNFASYDDIHNRILFDNTRRYNIEVSNPPLVSNMQGFSYEGSSVCNNYWGQPLPNNNDFDKSSSLIKHRTVHHGSAPDLTLTDDNSYCTLNTPLLRTSNTTIGNGTQLIPGMFSTITP